MKQKEQWKLIGRDQEKQTFKKLLESPSAKIWSISGPGGVGKTALLEEIQVYCEKENFSVLKIEGEALKKSSLDGIEASKFWRNVLIRENKGNWRAKQGIGGKPKIFRRACQELSGNNLREEAIEIAKKEGVQIAKKSKMLKDADYAIQCCIGAGVKEPSSWEPHYHRARIAWKMEEAHREAEETLEKLIRTHSQPSPVVSLLDGELAWETGDFPRCRKQLEQLRAFEDFPDWLPEEKNRWEDLWEKCL